MDSLLSLFSCLYHLQCLASFIPHRETFVWVVVAGRVCMHVCVCVFLPPLANSYTTTTTTPQTLPPTKWKLVFNIVTVSHKVQMRSRASMHIRAIQTDVILVFVCYSNESQLKFLYSIHQNILFAPFFSVCLWSEPVYTIWSKRDK